MQLLVAIESKLKMLLKMLLRIISIIGKNEWAIKEGFI